MQFTIQREAFLKPLKAVAGVVERRSQVLRPILSNVLIEVRDHELLLTTTDQEVELNASGLLEPALNADSVPGKMTLPLRRLMEICRTLPEGALITFKEEEQGRVMLRAGKSRFTLSSLPATEFPAVVLARQDTVLQVSNKAFKRLVEDISFAMAEQDVRYYLNGMLLELREGRLYGVAADGHRLALSFIPAVEGDVRSAILRLMVPRKGVLELQRILEDVEEPITLILSAQHLCVKTEDVNLISKLLEGKFPEYERIIPKGGDKVVIGKRTLLKEAFLRAAALFSDKSRGVTLQLSPGSLNIRASNAEQDEVEEDVEVDYQGDALEVGFNIRYLLDFLTVIQDEWIKFTFTDANSSARVEGVSENAQVYVLMPLRI